MGMKTTTIESLMASLASKPEASLKFYLDDVCINQGYHVTEVKYASVQSMDCGKHTDAWNELLIQLLDGHANSTQGFMSASKFKNIVSKALGTLPGDSAPDLFFEFAPGNRSLQKLKIRKIKANQEEIKIHLEHETAACKPFQRWGRAGDMLEKAWSSRGSACCSGASSCCG